MEFLTGNVSTIPDRSVFDFGIFAVVLTVCSCSQSPEKNENRGKRNRRQIPCIVKKPPSSFEDTVIVDREFAVFLIRIPCSLKK